MKNNLKFAITLGVILLIIIIGKTLYDTYHAVFIPQYNTNMSIKIPSFSLKKEETTTSVTYITLLSTEKINSFFTEYFKELTYKENKYDKSLPGIFYNEENKIIIIGYSIISEKRFTKTYQIIYSLDISLLDNYE
ncbi:MAG: hypothetical protein GX861_03270 [Tenericutes bacterium]|nr:hypothetical protein [Mycoplasmatota bacterium]